MRYNIKWYILYTLAFVALITLTTLLTNFMFSSCEELAVTFNKGVVRQTVTGTMECQEGEANCFCTTSSDTKTEPFLDKGKVHTKIITTTRISCVKGK